jgi:arylsulfatase A-like enzyme
MRGPAVVITLCAALLPACRASEPPPPLQRLIAESAGPDLGEAIRRAQQSQAVAAGAARARWEFEGAGPERDFTVLADVRGLRREGGRLRGDVTGGDPSLAVLSSFPAGKADSLWLSIASELGGNLQVFWATANDPAMTERKSLTVFVPASSDPVDVVLPVGAHGDWTGRLAALRIDPPPSSGAFSIDAVRVVSAAALPPAALGPLLERPATAVVDGVARLARLSPPPGRITWDVQVAPQSVLRLACGLLPESWPFASSATRFTVTAASSPGGEPRKVFSRELRPHALEADRAWHFAEVPLGPLGAGRLRLTLATEPLGGTDGAGETKGATAFAVWGHPEVVTPVPSERVRPNVVLIAVDAARADRLGVYGYPRGTTPAIDDFASRATVFEQARSQASWSLPSYASLFTSLYPSMAGVTRMSDTLPEGVPTLAGLLRDAGYSTAAFTGGGFAGRGWGLGRGFDVSWEGADPRAQVERLREWLGRRPAQPAFLYLHTFEAHDYLFERPHLVEEAERLAGRPLRLPAGVERRVVREAGAGLSRDELREISLLYDGALRVADRQVGHWLKLLRDQGVLDHAVVAVFADHGEAFGEHDVVHHGFSLFEELVRVPLVVRVFSPAGGEAAPRRVAEPVELVDLAPTLLEIAGVPAPAHFQGRSRAGQVAGGPAPTPLAPDEAETLSEDLAFLAHATAGTKLVYVDVPAARRPDTGGREAFLRTLPGRSPLHRELLYDLGADPGEANDLAPSRPRRLARAREGLVAALLRSTPGLRILARGGAEPSSLSGELRGVEGLAAPRILFPEPDDTAAPLRLRLEPGDLDLVSWGSLTEAALGELSLRLEASAGPLDVRLGPQCAAAPREPGLVDGRELLSAAAASPAPARPAPDPAGPSACVVFTPPRTAPAGEWTPSAEALERLRALGYVR